jgi:hypothetical protein
MDKMSIEQSIVRTEDSAPRFLYGKQNKIKINVKTEQKTKI